MSADARPTAPVVSSTGATIAIVVTMVTGAIPGYFGGRSRAPVLLLVCTAALVLGSTLVMQFVERTKRLDIARWLLFALCLVGAVVLWAGDETAVQIVFPLISMVVLFRTVRWGMAVTAIYLVETVASHVASHHSYVEVSRVAGGLLAGAVFVAGFSQLMRREVEARASADAGVGPRARQCASSRLRDAGRGPRHHHRAQPAGQGDP